MAPDPRHKRACPRRALEVKAPEVFDLMRDYALFKSGVLKAAGALDNQPYLWVVSMLVIDGEMARLERLAEGSKNGGK